MRGVPVVPKREPGAGREIGTLRVLERLGVVDLRTGDVRTGAVRAGVLRVVVGTLLRVVVEVALRLGCAGVARTGTREGGVLTMVGAGRVTAGRLDALFGVA